MNGALVLLLALLWALILLPGALRSRRSSPTTSVGTFERAMGVLARDAREEGRHVYVPRDAERIVDDRARRRQEVVERRRKAFVRLLASVGVTLPAAIVVGGAAWLLFAGTVGGLAAYVVLLRRWKVQSDEAAEVVRRLPGLDADEVEAGDEAQLVAVGYAPGGLQVATSPDEPWQPQASVRIRRWED